jgi:hypothetical protein
VSYILWSINVELDLNYYICEIYYCSCPWQSFRKLFSTAQNVSQNLKLKLFRTALARKVTEVQICLLRYFKSCKWSQKRLETAGFYPTWWNRTTDLTRSLNRWVSTANGLTNHSRLLKFHKRKHWSLSKAPDWDNPSSPGDLFVTHWFKVSSQIWFVYDYSSTGFNINCGRSRRWSNLKNQLNIISAKSVRFSCLSWYQFVIIF